MRTIVVLFSFLTVTLCRDYYVGMFKRNDLLVAQDTLYKERVPYRKSYAKYGRIFKCPITYFRVVDRLGIGRGPKVEIIRGGLQRKYLVLRLTSPYNQPISVNVYVGCENKMTSVTTSSTEKSKAGDLTTTAGASQGATEANGASEAAGASDAGTAGTGGAESTTGAATEAPAA